MPSEQLHPALPANASVGQRLQKRLDPKRLVFIDETWVKTNMVRLRG
jgi:hypothetical protein